MSLQKRPLNVLFFTKKTSYGMYFFLEHVRVTLFPIICFFNKETLGIVMVKAVSHWLYRNQWRICLLFLG